MNTEIKQPVDWVDPLIDTANRRFFFLTTASHPFGMVNLSPDTRVGPWSGIINERSDGRTMLAITRQCCRCCFGGEPHLITSSVSIRSLLKRTPNVNYYYRQPGPRKPRPTPIQSMNRAVAPPAAGKQPSMSL